MKLEIISVGTELLLGDILNTNAQWLCREIAALGINIYRTTCVGDNESRLMKAFDSAFEDADIVITTGGLGPTDDDLTKETAAKYLKKELNVNKEAKKMLEEFFKGRSEGMIKMNLKQAYFPEDSIILPNPFGTAPGCIMEGENGKVIIVMPGPPREMKPMLETYVRPYLVKLGDGILFSQVLRIASIGESEIAYRLSDIIENQTNPTVAPYAKDNEVLLRITAKAGTVDDAKKIIEPVTEEITRRFGKSVYAHGEISVEKVVSDLIRDKKKTISLAESCTGGNIAAMLTALPGASDILKEGLVCYSIDSKIRSCDVDAEIIKKHGVYSTQVTQAMVRGIAEKNGSDYAIATNGIAGPSGTDEHNSVGDVYIGIYADGECEVKKFKFKGDRNKIIRRASYYAINELRLKILGN